MSDCEMGNYGDELSKFKFDYLGGHPDIGCILLNADVVVCENGLLIKGMLQDQQAFLLWRRINSTEQNMQAPDSLMINFENGTIELGNSYNADIDSFEELIFDQIYKHRRYDYLKKLETDIGELSVAMDRSDMSGQVYFDSVSGDIIYVPEELDEDNAFDDDYVQSLPQWEREMADDIKAIYEDEEDRYHFIPQKMGSDAYETMVEFAKRVDDPKISDVLFHALDGRGAFRRFKEALEKYPKIKREWFTFKDKMEEEQAREWLYTIGIDPIDKKKK